MNAPLAGATVELRALEDADCDRVLRWRNEPEVARHMYTDHTITVAEHAAWFAGARADPTRRYWIIESDGAPVGLANLYDIARAHRRCAWAFYLADPATRGRGVGSFVEYLVLSHVFDAMSLNKLCCEVLAQNEAVLALHESFGFRREALLRAHIFKANRYEDVIALALFADEWRAGKGALRERLLRKGLAAPS